MPAESTICLSNAGQTGSAVVFRFEASKILVRWIEKEVELRGDDRAWHPQTRAEHLRRSTHHRSFRFAALTSLTITGGSRFCPNYALPKTAKVTVAVNEVTEIIGKRRWRKLKPTTLAWLFRRDGSSRPFVLERESDFCRPVSSLRAAG